MTQPAFALLDGNNFYVSCERVFAPKLSNAPVIVLSNNDGCAIARSEEAKALGVRMGAPWFQIRHLERTAGLVALSANFELYGDMSDRMMRMADALGCGQEVYSIDECFLNMTGIPQATQRAWQLQAEMVRGIGLPTCIGIGPTKTLAKLANHMAKSADRKPGSYPAHLAKVCNLNEVHESQLNRLLDATPVQEVWGVGPRVGQQLQALGIRTALALKQVNPAWANRKGSVVLERTVRELQGVSCIALEQHPSDKQQIAHTRSFGRPVTELQELREAVTEFAAHAAQKLRQQHSHAQAVLVYIRTSRFRPQDTPYAKSITLPMEHPSASTLHITATALKALQMIHKAGHAYAKAGVFLLGLQPASMAQTELQLGVSSPQAEQHHGPLMQALDHLNARYGAGTITLGTAWLRRTHPNTPRNWAMKQTRRSPRYTTRWNELLTLNA